MFIYRYVTLERGGTSLHAYGEIRNMLEKKKDEVEANMSDPVHWLRCFDPAVLVSVHPKPQGVRNRY